MHAITVLVFCAPKNCLGSVDISIVFYTYYFMGLILLYISKLHLVQGLGTRVAINTHGHTHVSMVVTAV